MLGDGQTDFLPFSRFCRPVPEGLAQTSPARLAEEAARKTIRQSVRRAPEADGVSAREIHLAETGDSAWRQLEREMYRQARCFRYPCRPYVLTRSRWTSQSAF